jgi:spermidine synthase
MRALGMNQKRSARITLLAVTSIWIAAFAACGACSEARAQLDPCTSANALAGLLPSRMEHIRRNAALVTDGAVAAEGALWDSAPALMLDTAASAITYDLGRELQLSAVYLQADANDTYTLSAASELDGIYRPLVKIANVIASGHGLRGRTARFAPVRTRFVRVSEPRGDGAFSVSELALYCEPPTPFPPPMRVVAGKLTPQFANALALREDAVARRRLGWFGAASGLAGFALFVYFFDRRRRRTPLTAAEGSPAPSADARLASSEGGRAVATPASGPSTRSSVGMERLLLGMFVASGCAALSYEIVWVHLMRLVIGASALSVAIVLASFMGGMFVGSLLLARWVPRTRNPLRVYAALEIGIALFGLIMPVVLPFVRSVYAGAAGHGPLGIALRALIAAALLLPPTALMGATLPAIARRYAPGAEGNGRLAALYAANTLGAVVGCIACGFYLLAVWDVWVATFTAAGLNLLIAALAWRAGRSDRAASAGGLQAGVEAAASGVAPAAVNARTVYVAAALSGATALGSQVLWTRLLTLLFGATVYAFSIILAVFLGGLGIGAAWAARMIQRGVDPMRGLAATQLALVPALLWAAALLAGVLPYSSVQLIPASAMHALHVLRALEVTLPAAILWGMTFPFALAAVAHDDPGKSTGQVYAANTVGSIAGALVVSFWTIPARGTHWSTQFVIAVAALSAGLLWLPRARALRAAAYWPALSVIAFGALVVALTPALSGVFLAHGRHLWAVDERDRYPYISEGAASTVAVHIAPDGTQHFHVAGRVEASSNGADMRLQRLLGHLSVFAHPAPKSVLVVGLGAGVTAGSIALHPSIERIVICEIEPRVVGAARLFARENDSVLNDPRVQVVFDDARHFLATTDERFDIITSDPIHPWVRGNSLLFSREYYQVGKSRLAPSGVATQWVPLYDTSEQAIQIQMRTFTAAFPNASVWNSSASGRGYDVVLLGAEQPAALDVLAIQARLERSARVHDSLREVGVQSVYDLLATYGTNARDMQPWVSSADENRDFSLKLEYISGLSLGQQKADAIYAKMITGRTIPADLFKAPPEALALLRQRIDAMIKQP